MIARLKPTPKNVTPIFNLNELRTESDVEQKLVYPFLNHSSYLSIPSDWIRTKEYMVPTDIDKSGGKKFGYFPDYSIWIAGIPLCVIEAKTSDVVIDSALREARLYAVEINKRYPPGVNPIEFIVAFNGKEIGITKWDSETDKLEFDAEDAGPGSSFLSTMQTMIGRNALEDLAKNLATHFQRRPFFSVSSFLGNDINIFQQLGVNEFAQPLFPTLTKYFSSTTDETPDDVIDRAYVTSEELGSYEGVLETYLKDRGSGRAGNQLKPIETSRHRATGISSEVQQFANNPSFFSRVQLIVGSVGAGKSTFILRFYRRLMSDELKERTLWAFLNFNISPPDGDLQKWICDEFIKSFSEINSIDTHALSLLEKIFNAELKQFENGPNKRLLKMDPVEFERRRSAFLTGLTERLSDYARCIARHFSGEKGKGIVVVFDNVDKRSRDTQLRIFEAAQWFKGLTRALVLVNLRDSTFEAHRDEPPLDAFANAINFYIRPPRFAQVIKKRLELVLDLLPGEVSARQEYALTSGQRILYPASNLGEYLMTIYLSLFDQRSLKVASALEALVAKDVRRALGMFADILVSPHIPTEQITGTILSGSTTRIQEFRIIRSLMRQRYKFFNNKTSYIRNVLDANLEHRRPSNFIYLDILEYLVRNRRSRIDYTQEGYAAILTIKKKMSSIGYDEDDTFIALKTLTEWGLVELENLVADELANDDAVRMHASGFIHTRFFLDRVEYIVSVTTDMRFASRGVAEEIGSIWASQAHRPDLTRGAKRRILQRMQEYFENEYDRRCRRHPFYEQDGHGGKRALA